MQQEMDWVKDLVIYQIYPRSFVDSMGMGWATCPASCKSWTTWRNWA